MKKLRKFSNEKQSSLFSVTGGDCFVGPCPEGTYYTCTGCATGGRTKKIYVGNLPD
jgi:hypothetical protein